MSSWRVVVKVRLAQGSGTGVSVGRVAAERPWVRAFWEERFLPSGVRGPVDLAALARFRWVMGSVVNCPPSAVEVGADGEPNV
jgi:hypothetical protein